MRYIPLYKIEPGMRLARPLYDSFGRILINDNYELTETYIERLRNYNVDGIYIMDEVSNDIQIKDILTHELRMESMACVRDRNIDDCEMISRKIVAHILAAKDYSLDLADLHISAEYAYAHSVNVAVLCCVMGIGLNLDREQLVHLVMAALLHDLGKLSLPTEIINKPARLTQEEYRVMQTHVLRSYELISERADIHNDVKNAVLYHHENLDGSGYPYGVDEASQSIITRILHVADVYNALTSKRPYTKPYAPCEAVEYMMGGCGILFDKRVVEMLLLYVPVYPRGSQIMLSNGRPGIVYDNKTHHNMRPIVKLLDGFLLDLAAPENLSLTILINNEKYNVTPEESEKERIQMVENNHQYHVMAIDDMSTNLHILHEMLEGEYKLTLLKSGTQAINYLKKHPYPDLILMDIDMPEIDGVKTAQRINKISNNSIPILFLTAVTDRNTVILCHQMNAAGYIIRPYQPTYVKAEIKRILTGRGVLE